MEFLPRAIKEEEEIKGIQTNKETVKISLFADYMILNLKDPKNSTPKLLDTINSYSKVAGYKINLQKPLAEGDSKMVARGSKQKACLLK
jgi:hypothetical protein